jgi:hypothetical protein
MLASLVAKKHTYNTRPRLRNLAALECRSTYPWKLFLTMLSLPYIALQAYERSADRSLQLLKNWNGRVSLMMLRTMLQSSATVIHDYWSVAIIHSFRDQCIHYSLLLFQIFRKSVAASWC